MAARGGEGDQSGEAWPGLERELGLLAGWFERQKRVLPWRDEPTLYRVWVSEIMLQQTQVATVVPYFERFLEAFPSVEALAAAPVDSVLQQWAGLGYYSRARNLQLGARRIVAQGAFPRDREGWLEIPGVGPYTAGAILSIALDSPEAILDGNVERVLSRVRRVTRGQGDAAYKARLWRLSRILVERGARAGFRPSVINQALMELGATVCAPRTPRCELCPIAELCRGRATGDAEAFPSRKKPKEWVERAEQVHCLFDGAGRMLLTRREPGQWRAGLWDFPEERPVVRGCVRVGKVETRHVVTRHRITRLAHVWRMASRASEPEGSSRADELSSRWVTVASPDVAAGSALRKTLQSILETFPEVSPAR